MLWINRLDTCRYFEEHPEESILDLSNANVTGLGTGLLATAAVSLAPTLAELPSVAAEVVRIAFRLGVHVDGVSENLEPRDPSATSPDTWAAVIPGISPDDVHRELEAHREKEVSNFHHPRCFTRQNN